ncbi:MAG: hypothetical protein LBS74_04160 [Oscillospiraceae bacterium]|jgi:hypothetical protein|nr:hypothetical protein [Oscillospiraceae bacterium]
MKKIISLVLLACCIVSVLAGCTSSPSGKSPTGASTGSTVKNVTVEEQVLLEKDGVKITLKSIEFGGLFGPELKVLIENDSANNITVQTRDSVVNGFMVDFILDEEVEIGKKSNTAITIFDNKLKAADITLIKDIEFKFHVSEAKSYDKIFDSDTIKITTSADPAYVQPVNTDGTVAYDEGGIKVTVKKLVTKDSFWGAEVYVLIENNTEDDVTVQVRNVSIDGFMVNPAFSSDVLKGKKSLDTITFMEKELTDNGIKDIKSIELSFHIYQSSGKDTIKDTDKITITF